MDAFLGKSNTSTREGKSLADRSRARRKQQNLLFNPGGSGGWSTRATQEVNGPSSSGQVERRGGSASSYWKLRASKLTEQAPAAVSKIFAGLSFYFNGRSGDKQTMHLKGAVSKHGARTTPFMSMRGVTHVIAENLSGVKTDRAMKSLKMKVVHPDWLTRCIAEGRLLPDAPFRVVRSQALGMDDFFRAPARSRSQAEHSETPSGRGEAEKSTPQAGARNGDIHERRESKRHGKGGKGKSRQHCTGTRTLKRTPARNSLLKKESTTRAYERETLGGGAPKDEVLRNVSENFIADALIGGANRPRGVVSSDCPKSVRHGVDEGGMPDLNLATAKRDAYTAPASMASAKKRQKLDRALT